MMLKANGEYLDFSGDIEIERQSKLFETFSETLGDFSYAFNLDDTANNRRILQLESVNQTDKILYQSIEAEIQNESGETLYFGLLRPERKNGIISCGFFSGNNNWITLITGNLLDIDWSDFDIEKSTSMVVDTWVSGNEGVIFPLVDKGGLGNRLGRALANNTAGSGLSAFDFHPFYFVKTIIKRIIRDSGLKITGDLINDINYQNLIITSNRGDLRAERVDSRTSNVGRTSSQSLPTSRTKLQLTSNDPFSDGNAGLWDNSLYRYTADYPGRVSLAHDLRTDFNQVYFYEVEVNGVVQLSWNFTEENVQSAGVDLNVGDYIEFYITSLTSTKNLLTGSSITIRPSSFDFFYASDYIPNMEKSTFIKNVFNVFNVIIDYNPFTKTINAKTFRSIKNESDIDISEYVSSVETDYYEFAENFGRQNHFKYTEPEITEIEDYNKANDKEYAAGIIQLENRFLQESVDTVQLDFAPPFNYFNTFFSAPLAKLNYTSYERLSDNEFDIGSVSDNGGIARFNVPGAMPLGLIVGRIVEIFDSSNIAYEGTGIVSAVTGSYFELVNVAFIDNATAKFNLIITEDQASDTPIIMVNSLLNVNQFSNFNNIYVGSTAYTTVPLAWFDRPRTGLDIDGMVNSLSFDPVNQVGSYQQGLIDVYYKDFKRVLNDPVKIYATCNLPEKIFKQITFLQPIRLRFEDFDCQFYGNKISGFKNSYNSCIVELIKRS